MLPLIMIGRGQKVTLRTKNREKTQKIDQKSYTLHKILDGNKYKKTACYKSKTAFLGLN